MCLLTWAEHVPGRQVYKSPSAFRWRSRRLIRRRRNTQPAMSSDDGPPPARCFPFADPNDSETLMNAGVYGRGFLLLMLFVVFLDARPARTAEPPALTDGPGPRVQPAPAQ